MPVLRRALEVSAMVALAVSLSGCGGDGDDEGSTTSPRTTSATATATGPQASTQTTSTSTSSRGSPANQPARAPSAATCAIDWNHGGATPQLLHVLGPTVRAAGPFQAEVGAIDHDCAVIIHATGVEGAGAITYEMRERVPGRGYAQAAVPPLKAPAKAILERDASLRLK